MDEFTRLASQCTKKLLGHRLGNNLKSTFQELTDSIGENEVFDRYGSGELIENFEMEIASVLGKEKAIFLPSGTMAQQIALRIWCDIKHNYTVAFHPTCHLETSEHLGYEYLHSIKRIAFGGPEFVSERMLTVKDFENLGDTPSVILIELPYRPLGGELPSWESLLEIRDWASKRNIFMHLDGARLWESKPFYQKEYQEICSLFDSVYVSFYKGLGGMTGSVLAGSESFIKTAKVWQRRYGGNLFSLAPYVLSARLSFKNNLEKIPLFVQRTQKIAEIFTKFPQLRIHPNPPHTNFFLLYINKQAELLNQRQLLLMDKYKAQIFPFFVDSNIPGFVKAEMHFFENALQFEDDLLENILKEMFQ